MQRNNTLFAGELVKGSKPVMLSSVDLLLFASFMKGNSIESALTFFRTLPISQILFSDVTDNQITDRINFLLEQQLLVNERLPSNKQYPAISVEEASDYAVQDSYRLSQNFSLSPLVNGYKLWSVKERIYYSLDPQQAFVLVLFCQHSSVTEIEKVVAGVVKLSELHNLIKWFFDHGVLVKNAVSIAENSVQANANKTPLFANLPKNPKIKPWQELNLGNRIPVYFVPHTENHYPLALGLLYSAITSANDGALLDRFLLVPITYLDPKELLDGPYNRFGPGVWLFSNYMWSSEINLKISDAVKRHSPLNLTVHGGPSTPDYQKKSQEFFSAYSSVDICVHGEGEASIVGVIENVERDKVGRVAFEEDALSDVDGITFRSLANSGEVVRTKSRARLKQPDIIPSPYSEGVFDVYGGKVEAAIIESNRGCPFGCTFCDWGSATNQKVRKYDLNRVRQELDWIIEQSVKVLWIADANFGMYDRDIELAQYIVDQKAKHGFPQEVVVNYTKNTTWRLAEIIKIFSSGGIISQGVISIQTTDESTLKVINRKNIKTKKYDELTQIFSDSQLPLSTDLMIGLPGSTIDSFKSDLQRYFDRDISVKAYPTQLLPNSPMADPSYMAEHQIEVDAENYLVSTRTYSHSDLDLMKHLYQLHTLIDGYSLLRYFLRYLQWDHSINYTDFLCALQNELNSDAKAYPHMYFAFQFFETDKCMPGGWNEFYSEIAKFTQSTFSIDIDDTFRAVLSINELAMPDEGRRYPIRLELEQDFESYFQHNKRLDSIKKKKLKSYLPSVIVFDDPDGMAQLASSHVQYDSHQFFWEVRSSIARAKSSSTAGHFESASNG
jgi:radical SAM superfamily enzyme YgiQ (UPF0313 family)